MHAIQDGLRSGDTRLSYARSLVRDAYKDESGAFNLSPVSESDEITALAAEIGYDAATSRMLIQQPMRKLAVAAFGQFAREGLYLNHPATFEQLEGMLLTAEHRLRHGGPFWGLGFRVKRWYASRMPSPKPLDRYKRPMAMAESERLLRAENGRRYDNARWVGFFLNLWFLVLIAGVWLLSALVLWKIASWIFRSFMTF